MTLFGLFSGHGRKWRDQRVEQSAPFTYEEFRAEAYKNKFLMKLPSLSFRPYAGGLAKATRDLPEPKAVVIYGSAVRRCDHEPNDIDILWLTDGAHSESKIQLGGSRVGYYDYGGTDTVMVDSMYHVAIQSVDRFIARRAERDEWARTAVQYGVLLVGDRSRVRWLRTLTSRNWANDDGGVPLTVCTMR